MSSVLELFSLQLLDGEAASLRAALADVESRLSGDEALDDARARLATAADALASTRHEQRRLEAEIADYSARIAPEDRRLYDGSVRNPKELGSIQHEVELLKAARAKLEDELLGVLTRLETETAEHEVLTGEVQQHERRREDDLVTLHAEAERLAGAISEADAKCAAQRTKVPMVSLRVYDDVRRRKGGVAVARITGTMCGACRVALPDAVRRRAMISEIPAQCPNCDRILCPG